MQAGVHGNGRDMRREAEARPEPPGGGLLHTLSLRSPLRGENTVALRAYLITIPTGHGWDPVPIWPRTSWSCYTYR